MIYLKSIEVTAKNKIKRLILEYLSQNRLMTLATCQDNTPWASTVFFAYDNNLNIYFLTELNTRKTDNILQNSKISAAINQVWQAGPQKVRGVQLEGEARMTEDSLDMKVFTNRFLWAKDYLKKGKIFKIRPKKIIYLDDEKFGPGGKRELHLD